MSEPTAYLLGGALIALAVERVWRAVNVALSLKTINLATARAEAKHAKEAAEAALALSQANQASIEAMRLTVDKVALYAGVRGKQGQAQ